MTQRKTDKKIFAAVAAVITAVCLLLSSCGASESFGVKAINSVSVRNVINPVSDKPFSYHYSESKESFTETASSSGLIEMRIDPDTNSFGIYESSGKFLWTALPLLCDAGNTADENCEASMVALRINAGTDIYTLNSQDNSLAYGTASFSDTPGGAVFKYNMFTNADTAEKETYSPDDIGFAVEMTVILIDGNMRVKCTCSNITGNKNAVIEDISVLNYFGAYNDMGEENFIFVPDGCGAIIKTSNYDESFESLSFRVYGNDVSNPSDVSGEAILPAFGMRRGNGSFAVLIEGGAAVATVKADKAKTMSEYNHVYSEFNITPVSYDGEALRISKAPAVEEISLCYRFLSGVNASYAGVASAIREQLIRNSVISTKTMELTDYLPMFVTLTGQVRKTIWRFTYPEVITDFDQATDMLTRVKSKGINTINLRYKAALSGGENQKDISRSGISALLGGSSGLSNLYRFMSSRDMELYLDADILTSSRKISSGNSMNISKEAASYIPESSVADAAGTKLEPRWLRTIGNLKRVTAGILADFKGYDFSGFCLDDAGSVLYSDFSSDGMLRQTAAEKIAETITPLSTINKIMVSRGNFYMLKNINSVIDIPLSTTVPKSGAYVPVPFVQLVLHGIVDYAGEPINLAINQPETMLKYIEYGACPHYQWNYKPIDKGTGEADVFFYENTVNQAAEFYRRADDALNDLRDARMTDHEEISDGVFCTEYDTGAMIYVNYTDTDYEISGITVNAKSFLRVG